MTWDALIGRIDRMDEYPDGTLEVVDYKSGRQGVEQDEVQNDLAMSCYQLLVKRKYPEQKVQATIIALRTRDSATASLEEKTLNEFESSVHQLGLEMLNRDYEDLTPVKKPLCERCDFLPLCKKHPEFEG